MSAATEIFNQIKLLTADIIGLGLCDKQNFPAIRKVGDGIFEIDISEKSIGSTILRNLPYKVIYNELLRTGAYNLLMLDGALIQMSYRVKNDLVEAHRLAFFPSPYLENFQNEPDLYMEELVYAEVIWKNIVPFPLRFDFDSREGVYEELRHPKSHLTLGQYTNCRIPVCAPLTPYHFVSFLLRHFYHTAYWHHSDNIRPHSYCFLETIFTREREILHIQVPSYREE